MLSMCKEIGEWVREGLHRLYPNLQIDRIDVTPATSREFGHYQCNQAMRLASILKLAPRQIAQNLIQDLQVNHGNALAKLEMAGPGFINFTLSDAYLCTRAQNWNFSSLAQEYPKEKVLIDFSSPNTAKEMHVGHLRSTIIGDCLARIHEFLGFTVLRTNHIGDWGTQFGMLIAWFLRKYTRDVLQAMILQPTGKQGWDLPFLMKSYQEAKSLFDSDSLFAIEAKNQVVALQSHEPLALGIWKLICDISRNGYQEIYDLLGVQITECGESFYNPMLQPMMDDLTARGFIEISEGAKCMFIPHFDIPLMLQKSDGGFNYDSTDMAAMKYRCHTLGVRQIIILTDAGQRLHFDLVFQAAQRVGYLPEYVKAVHVPFGLVLGPDGKKFKTRSGDTEKLADLIRQATGRARAILQERGVVEGIDLDVLAKALGTNAIKYADLSTYRLNDYSFSYDKMLRFEGNTAAFLMYSYVRCLGLLRRQTVTSSLADLKVTHASERQLLLTLLQFDEALQQTLADLAPNRLAEYLWILAGDFNAFFRDCRVEGHEHERSRHALVTLTAMWFGKGLELLGLQLVDRM